MERFDISLTDRLHTYCEHISMQVAAHIERVESAKEGALFVTGGGAFNSYLLSRIAAHSSLPVYKPSDQIIQYKEALVMALIGLLRWRNEPNVLSSVTGASRDSVGGALYHP
jgi:anhydro-N-acetylmuramic acid kinase